MTPASVAKSAASMPLVAPRRWDLGGAWRRYPWWRWWEDPTGDGGGILAATSVLRALAAVEVHGSDGGGRDVNTGRLNPDGGDVILAARLGNPR
jgi:hypothetical protein